MGIVCLGGLLIGLEDLERQKADRKAVRVIDMDGEGEVDEVVAKAPHKREGGGSHRGSCRGRGGMFVDLAAIGQATFAYLDRVFLVPAPAEHDGWCLKLERRVQQKAGCDPTARNHEQNR